MEIRVLFETSPSDAFGNRDARSVGRFRYGTPVSGGQATVDNETARLCEFGVTNSLWVGMSQVFDEPLATRILQRVGLSKLRKAIALAILDQSDIGAVPSEILIGSDDSAEVMALINELRTQPKECRFQSAELSGTFCVAGREGPFPTTATWCVTCDVPDERHRCSAYCHPSVVRSMGSTFKATAHCDHGIGTADASCVMGGKECWRSDFGVDTRRTTGGPPANVAHLLIDEFAHLRLQIEALTGAKLNKGSGEMQLGAEIVSPCRTSSEFVSHVASVSSLLDLLDGHPAAKHIGIDATPDGALKSLEHVLGHVGVVGVGQAITFLRGVPALRTLAPIHPVHDGRAATLLDSVGVSQPIDDYSTAWSRLCEGVRIELRVIRVAIDLALGGSTGASS